MYFKINKKYYILSWSIVKYLHVRIHDKIINDLSYFISKHTRL